MAGIAPVPQVGTSSELTSKLLAIEANSPTVDVGGGGGVAGGGGGGGGAAGGEAVGGADVAPWVPGDAPPAPHELTIIEMPTIDAVIIALRPNSVRDSAGAVRPRASGCRTTPRVADIAVRSFDTLKNSNIPTRMLATHPSESQQGSPRSRREWPPSGLDAGSSSLWEQIRSVRVDYRDEWLINGSCGWNHAPFKRLARGESPRKPIGTKGFAYCRKQRRTRSPPPEPIERSEFHPTPRSQRRRSRQAPISSSTWNREKFRKGKCRNDETTQPGPKQNRAVI